MLFPLPLPATAGSLSWFSAGEEKKKLMIHSLLIIIILVVRKDLVDLLHPLLGGTTTDTSLVFVLPDCLNL